MTKLPPVDIRAVLEAMAHDKKVAGGKIRFVLPRAIGDVFVTDDIEMKTVEKVLVTMR
jgi:3-dehydroquinate synthase